MMKQGEARAFGQWVEMVEQRRRLRNAAARLHSPGLARCFGEWRKAAIALRHDRAAIENAEWEKKFEEQLALSKSETERAAARDAEALSERKKLEEALDANRRAADEVRPSSAPSCARQRLAMARGETERDLALKDEAAAAERQALLERLEHAEGSGARPSWRSAPAGAAPAAGRSHPLRVAALAVNDAARPRRAAQQRLQMSRKLALAQEEMRPRSSSGTRAFPARSESERDLAMRDEERAFERTHWSGGWPPSSGTCRRARS